MNEMQIIACLARSRSRRNLCCGRYTPQGWFECDLAEITPSGYLREYEVKLTRRDFEADRLKISRIADLGGKDQHYKHDALKNGHPDGPVQFWFVVPSGLIGREEVPLWAGLIFIESSPGRLREIPSKDAPRLHRQKADPKVLQHMESVFYYRYWDLQQKLHRRAVQ
jgi:hypothetical protein